MNKNTPTVLSAAMLVITVVSLVFGLTAARNRRAAEEKVELLSRKVTEMQQKKNRPLRAAPTTAVPEEIPSADTNTAAELEAELTTLRAQLAEAQENRRPNREEREGWEDRMARMKEEDPEGYAEMIKSRQERQEQMKYNLAERTATFMDLDTSLMTEEELANHEQLIQKMAAIWEMTEMFNDPEQRPDREAMREMMEVAREVRPLMDLERNTMFKQLGTDLGYEGEDAAAFATHVDDIIEATSLRMPGGRGGRGGGGRGGR